MRWLPWELVVPIPGGVQCRWRCGTEGCGWWPRWVGLVIWVVFSNLHDLMVVPQETCPVHHNRKNSAFTFNNPTNIGNHMTETLPWASPLSAIVVISAATSIYFFFVGTKTSSNNALKGKFNPIWTGRWGGPPAEEDARGYCSLHNQRHLNGLQLTAAAPRWHAGCSCSLLPLCCSNSQQNSMCTLPLQPTADLRREVCGASFLPARIYCQAG